MSSKQSLRDGMTPSKRVVWYVAANGTETKERCNATANEWAALPSDRVQIVQVLFDRVHKGKHFQSVLAMEDYYWCEGGDGDKRWLAGPVSEIPGTVPEANIKTGRLIGAAQFMRMYNEAHNDKEDWSG